MRPLPAQLVGILVSWLVLAVAPSHAVLHPADGADADLRMRIGEHGVTWQVTLNLAFLDEILPVTREDLYSLHPLEYDALRDQLFEYLRGHDEVRIDGVVVTPKLARFSVEDADLSLLPLFPNCGTRALIKVSLVLEYSALQSPQEVAFRWSSYPPDTVMANVLDEPPPIEIRARLAVPGSEQEVRFRVEEPQYVWHGAVPTLDQRMLVVPSAADRAAPTFPALSLGLALGAVLAALVLRRTAAWSKLRPLALLGLPAVLVAAALSTGAGRLPLPAFLAGPDDLPDEAEALAIFQPLHTNIYRAFEYEDPSEIYDALSRSVEGALLDQLYHEIYQGLVLQEEGGAVCRVQSVTPVSTTVESIGRLEDEGGRRAFTVDARWQVEGVVHHFGHSHSRLNEYRARYTVSESEGSWRIHSTETLEQERLRSTPLEPSPAPKSRPADEI